jgi:hypothetical protein
MYEYMIIGGDSACPPEPPLCFAMMRVLPFRVGSFLGKFRSDGCGTKKSDSTERKEREKFLTTTGVKKF